MNAIVLRPFRLRFLLCIILLAILAWQFWTTSRYPSLNEKAMMSGALQLEDPLSFEAHIPLLPEYSVLRRIGVTTLNWIDTNTKGMTFGILFGATILTLFGYMRRHSFKGRFANVLAGLGFGAPLGVCVNCAAPIAKALYSGGTRAEVALAAMIASPTLNIVVLTMLFSIMPYYMAVTKIALSLIMILVFVPVICSWLPEKQLQRVRSGEGPSSLPSPVVPGVDETVLNSIWRFARDFLANFWFLIVRTLPLMLLAGFLGAVVATLLPADLLNNVSFGVFALFAVALVGTFLPVPIGFDVVTSGVLLSGGLEPGFVMALLFTLGIFSVYSFSIIAQSISFKAAGLMAGFVVLLGIIAGGGIQLYNGYIAKRALDILTGVEINLVASARASENAPIHTFRDGEHMISIFRSEYTPQKSHLPNADKLPFTKMEAWKLGIDQPVEFSFAYMWPPFWEGRSIASGDYDRDGDPDIVVASTMKGAYFYSNDGSGKFERTEFDIGKFSSLPIFNAALVDFDNDGWLDLFVTTYQRGNFVIPNINGVFNAAASYEVKNREDAILTLSASFADINKDGMLDAAIGNWAAGWYRRIPGEESRNRIIFGNSGRLSGEKYVDLPGIPGETLSVLFSDVNADNLPDLIVANDFEQPDIFYLGTEDGGLKQVTRQDGLIPKTTTTTMSVKTGDFDNDGFGEIYLAQIAGRSSGISEKLKLQPLAKYCDKIGRPSDREVCERNMAIKTWYKSGNNFNPNYAAKCQELDNPDQAECKAMLIKDLAIQNKDPSLCKLIPASQIFPKQFCEIHFRPIRQPNAKELDESIPQILGRNALLSLGNDGRFSEEAIERGLDVGGWSWDVKIADYNNDGWLDVYIVNGTWVPNEVSPSNLFFLNKGDGTFDEMTSEFGLEDYLITASAIQIDFDLDGDLDIISVPVNGPMMAFINNASGGGGKAANSVSFEFEDHVANRQGIGNRISLGVKDTRLGLLTREIQSGGGFMSFDQARAHFGLGEGGSVENVRIIWSDGAETQLNIPLAAGASYKIVRSGS